MELQESNEDDDDLSPSVSSPSHSNSTTKTTTKKRTRDLPNLTQCHSCGFRVDSCSGNENLEILYSEWRIVLLCQNCFVSVESSSLCSYCFKNGSSLDSFTCPQCKHIVHKTCFSSHANVAPWSFSCSSSTSNINQFSICLDCWVPNKRANFSSKRKNPWVFDLGNCRKKLLKNIVRDANFDAHRKVQAATRAWELAVEKALAARKMARLANNAISRVDDVKLAMRSLNCLAIPNGSCRILEVSPVPETSNYHSLGSNGDHKTLNFIKYARRRASGKACGDRQPDRYRIKYKRRGALAHETYNAKTKKYLIKYARRKLDRFAVKYTRRKLNQRPILDIPSRQEGATYDTAMQINDI